LCWAQRINYEHFVFVAEDSIIKKELEQMSLPFVEGFSLVNEDGTEENLLLMKRLHSRFDLIHQLLEHTNIFLANVTDVWSSDPTTLFNANLDVQGQVLSSSVNKFQLTGSLLAIKSSRKGRKFTSSILSCLRTNIELLQNFNLSVALSHQSYQKDCINDAARETLQRSTNSKFHIGMLPQYYFSTMSEFFTLSAPQSRGIWPVLVQSLPLNAQTNDAIIVDSHGSSAGIERLKDWQLWSLNDLEECTESPLSLPGIENEIIALSPEQQFILHIRVLNSPRPTELRKLLSTLMTAIYTVDSTTRNAEKIVNPQIDISFVIERSVDRETDTEADAWAEYERAISDFRRSWGWGRVDVHSRTVLSSELIGGYNFQLFGPYQPFLQPLSSEHTQRLLLVLYDYNLVTPLYYKWSLTLLFHYASQKQLTRRMAGFSLHNNQIIPYETLEVKVGQTSPSKQLKNQQFYAGQFISDTGGLVLFEQSWVLFTQWLTRCGYDLHSSTAEKCSSCVPGSRANEWILQRPFDEWTSWINRWLFERGDKFVIHPNFQDEASFVTMSSKAPLHNKDYSSYRKNVVNDKSVRPPQLSLPVQKFTSQHSSFSFHVNQIPLYDIQFQHVDNIYLYLSILPYRKNFVHVEHLDQCITIDAAESIESKFAVLKNKLTGNDKESAKELQLKNKQFEEMTRKEKQRDKMKKKKILYS